MSILNITYQDFVNPLIFIPTNKHTEADLQVFIDYWETEYLEDMLGCDLFNLFVADLVAGVPQTQIYIDIYEKFCIDEPDCGYKNKSEGMVKMIQKFVYWKYMSESKVKATNTGYVVNENEVARIADFSESRIYQIYNQAIKSYKGIQIYICDNLNDYPDYNGSHKGKTSWI